MKKYSFIFAIVSLAVLATAGCRKEAALSPDSVIVVETAAQNDFDKWLEAYFVKPYNIQFKYRYENNETTLSYYSIPPDFWSCVQMAHLVKYTCVDTYDEVAGIEFTREYFPKMFYLLGEWQYKNNGSFTLGTAEGGKKIFLLGLNYLPQYIGSEETLNHYYLKTIHHEFTHILNQTKDYPVPFKKVSGGTDYPYVTDDWTSNTYADYLVRGFISAYAQSEDREDFAETMALYVTHTQEWWDEQLAAANASAPAGKVDGIPIGADRIEAKLAIVRSYMSENFGIDLDQLRSVILRREHDIVTGKVDLTSLEIY